MPPRPRRIPMCLVFRLRRYRAGVGRVETATRSCQGDEEVGPAEVALGRCHGVKRRRPGAFHRQAGSAVPVHCCYGELRRKMRMEEGMVWPIQPKQTRTSAWPPCYTTQARRRVTLLEGMCWTIGSQVAPWHFKEVQICRVEH